MPGHTGAHGGPNKPGPSGFSRGPQGGNNRPNRPNMLDIAGPVSAPAAPSTPASTPPTGGGGGGGISPVIADIASAPTLAEFLSNFTGGGSDPAMSTAAVSAAPEVLVEEDETGNNSVDVFNQIANTTARNIYNTAPLTFGGLTPQQFGLTSLLGNIFNFNPQFDEEGNLTDTSLLGPVGTATFGAFDFTNPEYGMTPDEIQKAYNELYSQDLDSAKGYTVNAQKVFDSLTPEQQETFKSLDLSKTFGMTPEEAKEQMKQDRIDARIMGGGDEKVQPKFDSMTGAPLPGATQSTDQVTGDEASDTYNDFTEAQKATVDKMTDILGYDRQYGINYILGGGPTF